MPKEEHGVRGLRVVCGVSSTVWGCFCDLAKCVCVARGLQGLMIG